MSTAKLFINAICPFAQRAWIAARLKNAPVALEHVSLSDMPQSYIDNINPRATVPALISAEGRPVYESMFIAEYLDAQYGRPYDLFPRNSQVRADIRFFLDEAGNVVGSLYDTLRSDDASLKANQDELRGGLAKVEALLVKQSSGPFFLGAQVSLADVGVLPFLIRFTPILKHYKNIDLLAETPRLKALFAAGVQLDAVASTSPSVAHILKTYGSYAGHPLRVEVELPTLYTALGCPFAQRARLAQAVTKVPLKRVEIDLQNRPANFQELNPRNTVPFIIQPNGQKVFESLFIVKYLGEQRNDATNFLETEGSAIIPSTAQGVHDADFFVDDFPSSVLFEVITVGGEGRPKAVENAKSALATFEKRVKGPFALGAQVSFADIAVVPFLLRFEALTKLANDDVLVAAPKLQALLAAFRAIDGVAAEIETAEYYATGLKGYYKE